MDHVVHTKLKLHSTSWLQCTEALFHILGTKTWFSSVTLCVGTQSDWWGKGNMVRIIIISDS